MRPLVLCQLVGTPAGTFYYRGAIYALMTYAKYRMVSDAAVSFLRPSMFNSR